MSQYTEKELSQAARLMARMLPFMAEGMTFEQAGKAVLKRDKELAEMALEKSEQGQAIRQGISDRVYRQIKSQRPKSHP